jgi:hypothetical protein
MVTANDNHPGAASREEHEGPGGGGVEMHVRPGGETVKR